MPNKSSAERVVYHSPSNNEFYIICDVGQTEKYRKDPSIPLVDVVQAFQVFEGAGSGAGVAPKPSKSVLGNNFGTEDETEIIKTILAKGKIQNANLSGNKGTEMVNKHQ